MISNHEQRQLDQGQHPEGWPAPPVQGYGLTKRQQEKLRQDPDINICPDGHPSFPVHDWKKILNIDGHEVVKCLECGLAGWDCDENGVRTLEELVEHIGQ